MRAKYLIYFSAWPTEEHNIHLKKMTRRVEHITNLFASSKLGQSDNFMVNYLIKSLPNNQFNFSSFLNEKRSLISVQKIVIHIFFIWIVWKLWHRRTLWNTSRLSSIHKSRMGKNQSYINCDGEFFCTWCWWGHSLAFCWCLYFPSKRLVVTAIC